MTSFANGRTTTITTGPTEPSMGRLPTSGSWQRKSVPACHRSPETLHLEFGAGNETRTRDPDLGKTGRHEVNQIDRPSNRARSCQWNQVVATANLPRTCQRGFLPLDPGAGPRRDYEATLIAFQQEKVASREQFDVKLAVAPKLYARLERHLGACRPRPTLAPIVAVRARVCRLPCWRSRFERVVGLPRFPSKLPEPACRQRSR